VPDGEIGRHKLPGPIRRSSSRPVYIGVCNIHGHIGNGGPGRVGDGA